MPLGRVFSALRIKTRSKVQVLYMHILLYFFAFPDISWNPFINWDHYFWEIIYVKYRITNNP